MTDLLSVILGFLTLFNYEKPLSFLEKLLKSHYVPLISIAGMLIALYSTGMMAADLPGYLKEEGYSLYYFFGGIAAILVFFTQRFFHDRKKIEDKIYRRLHLLTFVSVCYIFVVVGGYVAAMLPYAEAMGFVL